MTRKYCNQLSNFINKSSSSIKFFRIILFSLNFIFLFYFSNCKPSTLNNPSDPNSKSYFENAVLLCALGVYEVCNPCKQAPGPWGSFVGTPSVGYASSYQMRTDLDYNLYSFNETTFNFGAGGINFIGTEGTNANYFVTKFSSTGQRQWISYLGQRVDRSKGLIVVENEGIYSYFSSSTSTLPNPKNSHTNNGENSIIVKHSYDGNILWARHYNDGSAAASVLVSHILNTDDNSGILVLGSLSAPLVNPGQVIGTAIGDSWFIQKIDYNGNAIWTRYYPFTNPINNFKVFRMAKLKGNNGYAIISFVSADVNPYFPGGINTFLGTSSTPLVMKLNSDFSYHWHRYFSVGSVSAIDDTPPLIVSMPDGNFITTAVFDNAVPSSGMAYPGTGNSSIFYHMSPTGVELFSSFLQVSNENITIYDALPLSTGKVLVSGSLNDTNGIVSELDPFKLSEDYRKIGKDGLRTSTVKHCDGSFSTSGISATAIPESILPFGTGTSNSYLSRFK